MAEKPKTYAMQVQELKDQLQQKDDRIAELLQENSFFEEMRAEIAHLKEELAFKDQQLQSGSVNSKAQNTDLVQRAEQAEQANRNAQTAHKNALQENAVLQEQIDILEHERLKNRGKDEKILLLHETLKDSNLRVAALQQQVKDKEVEFNEAIARMEKEIIYLRQLTRAQKELITSLTQSIEALPYDGLAELRRLAKNG